MRRTIVTMAALTFSLALFMPHASAMNIPAGRVIQDAEAEAAAYKAWYDANTAKDYPKAIELAKAYLEKFPSGKYVDYLKKWSTQMRSYQFGEAVKQKNVAELVRIGKEVLASEPDNLDYLSALVVQIRTLEISATPPNFSHSAEAADFAERSIKAIESGKTPTGAGANFNKNATLAYMHQTLALISEHDKNVDKALAEYEKAAQLENTNTAFFFHCGRLQNDKYAAAAQKYDAAQKKVSAIPEADRNAADPKPDVKAAMDEEKAALAEVNGRADAVIKCWARFLGLTIEKNPWGDTRARVEKALTDLYKYRHNDSDAGLKELIEQNRGTPPSS